MKQLVEFKDLNYCSLSETPCRYKKGFLKTLCNKITQYQDKPTLKNQFGFVEESQQCNQKPNPKV